MDRPCRIAIRCPGPQPGLEGDSPITNYSSEYTDGVDFPSFKFPIIRPYDPGRPGWWATDACGGAFRCISYISQEDADDCAAALAAACVVTPPNPPTTPDICIVDPAVCTSVGPELFPNQTQSASFICPDGSTFTWTIASGTVYADSTALANSVALALAQQRVAKYFICLPELPSNPCDESFYSVAMNITGNSPPFTVEVIDGILPPGISPIMIDYNTFGFEGTASGSGDYVFTVRATSATGAIVDKTYVMSVMGFLNTTALTEAVIGQAYTESMNGSGGIAPYTYEVTDGTLPAGLSMDTAGQITGTPTETGNNSFTITVTDSSGRSCSKTFTIAVTCLISTASLPNGTDGQAYSQTLTVNGFTGAVTWSIIAGALPSGLSLNSSTGEISGTPDTVETQAFTVQAQQGEFLCEKDLSIQVEAAPGINWTQLNWTNPQQTSFGIPPGTGTMDAFDPAVNPTQQDNFTVDCNAKAGIAFFQASWQGSNSASVAYTGPLAHCKITASLVSISAPDGAGCQANWIVRISGDSFAQFNVGGGADGDYLFDVPANVGNVYVSFEVNAISLETTVSLS